MRLSRRSFLAVAASAPFAQAVAANDKITLGFVGVGTMGRGHLGGFLGRNEVEVVAVCDVVKERLDLAEKMVNDKYAAKKKSDTPVGVKAYADFRKLLEHKGLDAVVIATPDHWHSTVAILAARAGKHIYCEKPLTQNLADGRAVVDAVAKNKVIFQTGSQQRSEYGNRFRDAVEAIWNGRIGKLHTVRIGVGGPAVPCDLKTEEVPAGTDWEMWNGPSPARGYNEILCPKGIHKGFPQWRKYREYAGGLLADMGAHHFDIAQWAMGTDRSGPSEVIPPKDPKATKGLRFVYPSGVVMIHDEFETKDRHDCLFEGSEGKIMVSRNSLSASKEEILKEPLPANAKRVYASKDHKGNWLECIRALKECICPAEVGHRTSSICQIGNIGYWLNKPLKWDAVKEQFDDAEANKWLSREPRGPWKV